MKVWLPAIKGLVPDDMVRCCRAFLEFSYIARKDQIDESDLDQLDDALLRFHKYRNIFITEGVREDFEVPRQHAMAHYRYLIEQFGAPNGLCTSITEHAHIAAVKEPWRRTNKHEPIAQMIKIHNRLSLLDAFRLQLESHGLLQQPLWAEIGQDFVQATGIDSGDESDGGVIEDIPAMELIDEDNSGHHNLGHTVDDDDDLFVDAIADRSTRLHAELDRINNTNPDDSNIWAQQISREDEDEPAIGKNESLDSHVTLAKEPGNILCSHFNNVVDQFISSWSSHYSPWSLYLSFSP
jgi:hypothetical protein